MMKRRFHFEHTQRSTQQNRHAMQNRNKILCGRRKWNANECLLNWNWKLFFFLSSSPYAIVRMYYSIVYRSIAWGFFSFLSVNTSSYYSYFYFYFIWFSILKHWQPHTHTCTISIWLLEVSLTHTLLYFGRMDSVQLAYVFVLKFRNVERKKKPSQSKRKISLAIVFLIENEWIFEANKNVELTKMMEIKLQIVYSNINSQTFVSCNSRNRHLCAVPEWIFYVRKIQQREQYRVVASTTLKSSYSIEAYVY